MNVIFSSLHRDIVLVIYDIVKKNMRSFTGFKA